MTFITGSCYGFMLKCLNYNKCNQRSLDFSMQQQKLFNPNIWCYISTEPLFEVDMEFS